MVLASMSLKPSATEVWPSFSCLWVLETGRILPRSVLETIWILQQRRVNTLLSSVVIVWSVPHQYLYLFIIYLYIIIKIIIGIIIIIITLLPGRSALNTSLSNSVTSSVKPDFAVVNLGVYPEWMCWIEGTLSTATVRPVLCDISERMRDRIPTRSIWSKILGIRGHPLPIIFARLVRPMNVLEPCRWHHRHHHHPRISSRRKSWNKTSGPLTVSHKETLWQTFFKRSAILHGNRRFALMRPLGGLKGNVRRSS